MSQSWYVKHNGKTVGPITSAQLKQIARASKIHPRTKIRIGKEGQWLDAARVKGLFPAFGTVNASTTSNPVQPQQTKPPQPQRASPTRPSLAAPARTSSPTPAAHLSTLPASSVFPNAYRPPTSGVRQNAKANNRKPNRSSHELEDAFREIWFAPRETVRWLIDERKNSVAIILTMIAFGMRYIENCLLSNESGALVAGLILAPIGIPISALFGVFVLYVFAFSEMLVGKAMGGKGNCESLRMAFSWSQVPAICSIPVTLLFIAIVAISPSFAANYLFVLTLPYLVLLGWGLVINVGGISAAHQFSLIKAIVTLILSVVFLIFALAGVYIIGGLGILIFVSFLHLIG